MIGHGLENIIPSQLGTFFALLYDMISIKDIINNKPPNDDEKIKKFCQEIQWPNGCKEINWLPKIKAPISSIQFWINFCCLNDNEFINSFKNHGYCSIEELQSEIGGYYKFYTTERFVF